MRLIRQRMPKRPGARGNTSPARAIRSAVQGCPWADDTLHMPALLPAWHRCCCVRSQQPTPPDGVNGIGMLTEESMRVTPFAKATAAFTSPFTPCCTQGQMHNSSASCDKSVSRKVTQALIKSHLCRPKKNITGAILLRHDTLKEMNAKIVMSIVATFAFANSAFAQNWNGLAAISNTLDLFADRLCVGADPSVTLGCPTYAPNLDASGNISTTGHISATAYYGDGSALTGISANTDRITSSSTNIIANSTGSISFTTVGTTAMVISGSNVGIGTTAPTTLLHVTGPQGYLQRWTGGAGGTTFMYEDAVGNFEFGTAGAKSLSLNTSTIRRLSINASGNVGIGTTAPFKTLHVSGTTHIASTTTVSGTIHATEIKVSNAEQPCNATSVGTLRWNAAKRRPEMCFPDAP